MTPSWTAEDWCVHGLQALGTCGALGMVGPMNRRPVWRAVVAVGTAATTALSEKDAQVYRRRAAVKLLKACSSSTSGSAAPNMNDMDHVRTKACAYLGQQLGLDARPAAMEYVLSTHYMPRAIAFKAAVVGLSLGNFGWLHALVTRWWVPQKTGVATGPTYTLHVLYGKLTGVPPYPHDTVEESVLLEWCIEQAADKFLLTDPQDRPAYWYRRPGGTKRGIFQME